MKKLKLRELLNVISQWLDILELKIDALDIRPFKPSMQELLVLADEAINAGNNVTAVKYLIKILAVNHRDYDVLLKLIRCYLNLGKLVSCQRMLSLALRYYPEAYELYHLLGYAQARSGNLAASVKAYQYALKLNPDLVTTQHLLNAVQEVTTAIAPREYIISIFDNYSSIFERNLVSVLGYCAHIELPKFMHTVTAMTPNPAILDLGCGTGLLGQEFKKYFKPRHLVGVDLAPNMLLKSQEKAIYTELHNADLIEYLQQTNEAYDIIGSTDVLVYIGDLAEVFAMAYARLKPGGCFGFSVESLDKDGFKLRPSGRYQHSLNYIQQLSSSFNFSRIYSKLIDLRKEHGKMVPGYLVLLQK